MKTFVIHINIDREENYIEFINTSDMESLRSIYEDKNGEYAGDWENDIRDVYEIPLIPNTFNIPHPYSNEIKITMNQNDYIKERDELHKHEGRLAPTREFIQHFLDRLNDDPGSDSEEYRSWGHALQVEDGETYVREIGIWDWVNIYENIDSLSDKDTLVKSSLESIYHSLEEVLPEKPQEPQQEIHFPVENPISVLKDENDFYHPIHQVQSAVRDMLELIFRQTKGIVKCQEFDLKPEQGFYIHIQITDSFGFSSKLLKIQDEFYDEWTNLQGSSPYHPSGFDLDSFTMDLADTHFMIITFLPYELNNQ